MAMNLLLVGKSVELSPSMNLLLLNISKEIVRQQLIQPGKKAKFCTFKIYSQETDSLLSEHKEKISITFLINLTW